ncbi:hypothetical protein HDU78_010320, partial [Chytriomyces hyalinus]
FFISDWRVTGPPLRPTAGTYGVAMSQTMSQFLASQGLSWVPSFVSSHAAVLCTVGGAAAILGGIGRIVISIIGLVQAVKENNKGLETAAERLAAMYSILDSLHAQTDLSI